MLPSPDHIQINPYEALCLSRHLCLATGQFIVQHTNNNGLFLRFTSQGACGFLTDQGYRMHPKRSLVCRLYPLGREIDQDQGDSLSLLPLHPQCPARWDREEWLQDYLE
ncbi:hypothetical protein DFAR_1410002 [Desulfarculales bacterium]